MPEVTVREFQPGDGEALAQIIRENTGYYANLAPDYFKQADAEGLPEFVESDNEWRAAPENFGRIAEVDGEVAGYIEATIQAPMDTAQWQSQRDLAAPRLFIGFVQTSDRFKRMGVATHLVEAAEEWGRQNGAKVATCDTYIDSPMSVPFWEKRMGYTRRAIVLRKQL
ncbi:MAG: GNAT family N-acetyltransferase [Actinobacteria bacterium]|nr:GNAT family N-acetyltransferase [Actinomycetota bacterium]